LPRLSISIRCSTAGRRPPLKSRRPPAMASPRPTSWRSRPASGIAARASGASNGGANAAPPPGANAPPAPGPVSKTKESLALDPGKNAIEVVAYNERNLLASRPAQATITYNASADAEKPKLHVLAIGINDYHDEGWMPPGATQRENFPPLKLAVDDARSI